MVLVSLLEPTVLHRMDKLMKKSRPEPKVRTKTTYIHVDLDFPHRIGKSTFSPSIVPNLLNPMQARGSNSVSSPSRSEPAAVILVFDKKRHKLRCGFLTNIHTVHHTKA